MLLQVDAREFAAGDLGAGVIPVLFVATWCGFCHRILPHFKRKAAEAAERPHLVVDVSDEDSPLWDDYALEYVPTLMVFRDGTPGERIQGIMRPDDMDRLLAKAVT